jgi:hypothetical protein
LLFPGSDLRGALHQVDEYIPASNAIRKKYLAGSNAVSTVPGDLLFFYRKKHSDESGPSTFKSAVTTLGIAEKVYREGRNYQGFDDYCKIAGRRTVFTKEELSEQYEAGRKTIIQFLYVLSFEKGNNVNHRTLADNGVIVYVTKPVGQVLGEFEIADLLCATPGELWEQTAQIGGINEQAYFEYFKDTTQVLP